LPDNMNKIAKALRNRPTDAEKLLWDRLKQRQVNGLKFRRQQPIDNYIVDFACMEKRLVIEVDGGQHAADKHKDEARDYYLRCNGFRVLRFWNHEVINNMEAVLAVIWESSCSPSPSPPPARGGDNKAGAPPDGSVEK
jgi:very-short-patch-repair endonuclease